MTNSETLRLIIESRRSIFPKDYTGEPVPEQILNEILASAAFAPNHKRTKPWRFLLFQGEEKNQLGRQLADIYRQTAKTGAFLEKKFIDIPSKFEKSDAVIAVCVNFSGLVPEWEEIAAVAMAVQNMYLTCAASGVGCYWSTPAMKDHIGAYLGLDDNQKCLGFFYMGMIAR